MQRSQGESLEGGNRIDRGVGEGVSRSFELIATPALCGLIGFGVDRLLGTAWVFTAALAIFGIVGTTLSTWYRYDARMRVEEAKRRAAATGAPSPAGARPTDQQVSAA